MNELKNDNNLRQAVSRREQQQAPMPADLNERLMQRLGESETAPRGKARRLWLYAIVAAAASIALLIVFNVGKGQAPQEPLVAQTVEQPVASEPVSEPVVVEEPRDEAVKTEAQPSSQPVRKHRKAVVKLVELIPASEAEPALMADAKEPANADDPAEEDPLVAMAAQVEDIRQRGMRLHEEIRQQMKN